MAPKRLRSLFGIRGLEWFRGLEGRYWLTHLYANQPFLSTLPNVSALKEKTATSMWVGT